jgi:formate hydrogenlyase subunit 6/NADH:ubiquinone oxidoreductase subunit I
MNRNKINAYIVIATLFLWHIIKKYIFRIKKNDIKTFRKNYYPEFLIEIPKTSYEQLSSFESCINCSLCDAYCSTLTTFHRDGLPKLSGLILSNSSSLDEFRF